MDGVAVREAWSDNVTHVIAGGRPAPPPTPKPKPVTKPPGNPDTSAKLTLVAFLNQFGLGGLAEWAWQTYTGAGGGDLGMQLVQAELPDQALFKQRFPAIAERTKAGLPSISPADYINYETTIRQAFTAHGLPLPTTGGAFNDIITRLLVGDVSAAEVVNQRIGSAFDRVNNAPVEVRQAFQRLWGVQGDSAMAAYFLDQTHSAPELERLSKAADVAGTAQRFGIDINRDRALRLADLGADNNLGAFSQLGQLSPLFNANPGEQNPDLSLANEGVAAAFGEDATSQQAINRRLATRKAELEGGGGPVTGTTGQGGVIGLGSGPV